MSSPSLHEKLIALACQNGWSTGPWKAAFRRKLQSDEWHHEAEGVLSVLRATRCIPDAWRIRVEGEDLGWGYDVLVLELLEVEVTHPVSREKIAQYENLWWAMDYTSAYHLRVHRMDRYGNVLPLLTEESATAFFGEDVTGEAAIAYSERQQSGNSRI
jgi:hypothetical protein